MRNALVVLVPVCIGLTSGFIVPSSIQEVTRNNNDSNVVKTRNILRREACNNCETVKVNKLNSSEKVANEILDKEIYELTKKKDFNLTERSFVYIKKRTKNPLRHNFYIKQIPKNHLADNNNVSTYLEDLEYILQDIPRRLSVGYVDKNILETYSNVDDSGPCRSCKFQHSNRNKLKNGANGLKMFDAPKYIIDIDTHKDGSAILNESRVRGIEDTDEKMNLLKGVEQKKDVDNDYAEIVDHLLKTSDDLPSLRKNNLITHNGFHYCRDCIEKAKLQGFHTKLSIIKQCKCGIKNILKDLQNGNNKRSR